MKKNFNFFHLFLFLLISFLISYSFLFLSTYVHEKAHVNEAKKFWINFYFEINLFPSFNNLKSLGRGLSKPFSREDCLKFNSLLIKNKRKIMRAGVKAELMLFVPLFIISLFCLFYFKGKLSNKNKFILWLIIILCFLFLLIILSSLYYNVFSSNPGNDWNMVNFTNCSIFKDRFR